jgi:uncharacterized Zn finger protein
VAQRRANASKFAANLAKKERRKLAPVEIAGRKIAASFWGNAWCENLERYSDFANRLPRGRTYVRNGSVIDLQIGSGSVKAIVSGSEIYRVTIRIQTLVAPTWQNIKQDCSQSVASLMDLLQGRFDDGVMQRLTQRDGGLFPQPREIEMDCSCPDWAGMCKHVAATLYGIGSRLDSEPEMLFTLRDVDHLELVSQAVASENLDRALSPGTGASLGDSDLGEIFGIDIASKETSPADTSIDMVGPATAVATRSRRVAMKSRHKTGKNGRKNRARTAPIPSVAHSDEATAAIPATLRGRPRAARRRPKTR